MNTLRIPFFLIACAFLNTAALAKMYGGKVVEPAAAKPKAKP